jgi:hypothetical protein
MKDHPKKMRTLVVAAATLTVSVCGSASRGAVLFQDDFEAPHAALNSVLSSVTPIVGDHYTTDGSNVAHVRNTSTNPPGTVAAGGSQFVEAPRTDGWVVTPASTTLATNKLVTFSFDFYLASDDPAAPRKFLDLVNYDSGRAGFDLVLYGDDGSIAYFDGPGQNTLVTLPGDNHFARDTWVPFNLVADFSAGLFTATVGTFSFSGDFATWAALGGDHIHTFDTFLYSTGNAPTTFYDNILITVPEPASLGLLAMGGLLLLRRRRH